MSLRVYIYNFLKIFSLVIPLLIALSTGIIDLLPGALLTLFSSFLSNNTWLLLLYPPLLSFRGTLGGIYTGRLTTSLHLGSMFPSFLNNSEEYYTLLIAMVITHILGGIIVSLIVSVTAYFIFGYTISIINHFLLMIFSVFFLTQLVMFPLVTIIAKLSYLKGWDPDVMTYPFTSSLGDVTITFFFIIIAYLIIHNNYVYTYWLLICLSLGNFILPFIFYLKGFDSELFITELKESFLAILLASGIVTITGYIFRSFSYSLERNPLIYFIYPTILTSVGDSGSVVGSVSTTKLALIGKIDFKSLLKNYFSIIILLVAILFPIYGLIGHLIFQLIPSLNFFIKLSLGGVISVLLICSLSIFTALITYKKGLDPDHFVTPLESTIADSITTFVLYILFTLSI